ncbi:MAG: hypothetical protein KDA51_11290, partial [Planctomycetales bacterium]|nr:hypothetical protein [Planctomycetales bacterium]
ALTVINALNAVSAHNAIGEEVATEPSGEGTDIVAWRQEAAETVAQLTTPPTPTAESYDMALVALYSATSALELEAERRRNR